MPDTDPISLAQSTLHSYSPSNCANGASFISWCTIFPLSEMDCQFCWKCRCGRYCTYTELIYLLIFLAVIVYKVGITLNLVVVPKFVLPRKCQGFRFRHVLNYIRHTLSDKSTLLFKHIQRFCNWILCITERNRSVVAFPDPPPPL